jgi:hypothetical protein
MMESLMSFKKAVACVAALLLAGTARATSLNVYAFNFSDDSYQAVSPYVNWSQASVTTSVQNGTWVPADQFLAIETDMPQGSGNWAIQIFTDNRQVANAHSGNPQFNLPDYFLNNNTSFVSGGLVNGPLTPAYVGNISVAKYPQSQCQGTPQVSIPASGLISSDGQERIPLIWRLFDNLPFPRSTVPAITENPQCSLCDFDGNGCEWFYFLDKGDELIPTAGAALQYSWQDGFWYSSPLSQNGAYYVANQTSGRFAPTVSSNGFTTQYLVLASNFHNGTRQVYSTTIFVELITL